ncbi:unnamed protein product [Psylliodes chrysocephalus]|uniref:Arf-GAP with coiled-coil, ANK repeat and PH domain-containing protein 2 n=1 Tax=Psylliodes chrysocephalus TaxID=3402493 RepID=A0A9P0GE89_9CUCU|nr:unnamed protein product [Psylliodes chrysocephala]
MVGRIELQECLRDSPKFRGLLEAEEASVDQLESKLEKILKVCGSMVDSGKTYVGQQSLFANSLWDLSTHFKEDPMVLSSLNKLIHSLQEMNKFHTILLDQASRTILKNLTSFIKNDIKGVRDYKQHFEKISTEYDNILLRNSHTPRSKPQEVEEIQNVLVAVRSCFGHNTLDYINSISVLQSKKRHEILSTLLSYMHACTTYYHQGSDLCADLETFFKTLADEIGTMRGETYKVQKELENTHSVVSNFEPISIKKEKNGPTMEGYLFKRTSNAFKTWNRRWFYLYDNKLVYRKRSGEEHETIMEDDLRICTVKPVLDGERRFCFEVLSPLKSHMLQADTKEMYDCWITALQKGIGAAIQRIQSIDFDRLKLGDNNITYSNDITGRGQSRQLYSDNNNRTKKRMWEQLLKIPGNNYCCDCRSANPRWASINLGITLCIECSGVHRSLGVHYSKVRSLTLDDWEPEIIKVMVELGNAVVNKIYEATMPDDVVRPSEQCPGAIRETFIKAKYVDKKYVKSLPQFNKTSPSSIRNSRPSSLMDVRKWSVRKIRRRPRSCDKRDRKHVKVEEVTKKIEKIAEIGETSSSSGREEDTNSESSKRSSLKKRNSILLFGSDLDKQPIDGPIDLSSDQESTGGEEENETVGEEDISKLQPDLLLYKAAAAHNLPVMCEALALGGDKCWINPEDRSRSPLHAAVFSGSVMPCAYLILNGVKINAQDQDGKTPLHIATQEGHTAQVCLFLKHRADQHLEDDEGKVPLSIAEQKEHADIVTLLRLGRLNDEMKDSEIGVTGDDTFNEVVRDFSRLACSHPEKLQRPKIEEDRSDRSD